MSNLKAKVENSQLRPIERLVLIMEILRSEEGCAWDRAQSHESLLPYLIEETYEVVDTIEAGDRSALPEELGDLLCQIVFHAQMGQERGEFSFDDVAAGIGHKLIRRHPHVFGEKKDLNPQQVRDQWEKIKTESGEKRSVLGGLPASMPALVMAFRLGEKAGGVGFDWPNALDALGKVEEELGEVRRELATEGGADHDRLSDEIGDLLFAVASVARKAKIDPELALKRALTKFRTRFERLEDRIRDKKSNFDDFSLAELEKIWQQNKEKLS